MGNQSVPALLLLQLGRPWCLKARAPRQDNGFIVPARKLGEGWDFSPASWGMPWRWALALALPLAPPAPVGSLS